MKLWQYFIDLVESLGRARAAASLTRMGKYEEARQLMLERSGKQHHVKS